MLFHEALVTLLAVSLSWLILPLVIPLALVVAAVFLIWHGVPTFSWDAPEPAAEPHQ